MPPYEDILLIEVPILNNPICWKRKEGGIEAKVTILILEDGECFIGSGPISPDEEDDYEPDEELEKIKRQYISRMFELFYQKQEEYSKSEDDEESASDDESMGGLGALFG